MADVYTEPSAKLALSCHAGLVSKGKSTNSSIRRLRIPDQIGSYSRCSSSQPPDVHPPAGYFPVWPLKPTLATAGLIFSTERALSHGAISGAQSRNDVW